MGFLHKLWDETVAGPPPETGLGKLRKYNSFSAVRSAHHDRRSPAADEHIAISRSITILKSNNYSKGGFKNLSLDVGSDPSSPTGSSTSGSPMTPGTPRGDFRRFTRKKSSAEAETISPTAYDWIMISALDR